MQRRDFVIGTTRAGLGFSILALGGCSSQERPSAADPALDSLVDYWEANIPQWLAETKMPAVSIATIRNGEQAWTRAFGVKDTGTQEPVDNDTIFAACSNTKPVFAYGVMKMCEKGQLDLDRPLTDYTKLRVTQDPRIERITARHVLNHTTGFPNWRQGFDLPIDFDPGSKYQYSGEGFSYLQSVVLEITGQSFDGFMRDNILKPLGMTASHISEGLDYVKVAKPHDERGQRLPGKYYTPPSEADLAEGTARYGAAAMLMTTPSDYATFLLEFLSPKPADDFRLSEGSREEMVRPQFPRNDGFQEGLAWPLEQHPGAPMIFAHSGQDAGYYCIAAGCVERQSGFMVMLNGDAYTPMVMKMFADPGGGAPNPQTLWPGFVKRYFGS